MSTLQCASLTAMFRKKHFFWNVIFSENYFQISAKVSGGAEQKKLKWLLQPRFTFLSSKSLVRTKQYQVITNCSKTNIG